MSEDTDREERRHQIIGAVFLVGLVLVLVPLLFDRARDGEALREVVVPERSEHSPPLEEAYTPPRVEVSEEIIALSEPLLEAIDEQGFRTDTGVRFGDPAFLPANDPRAADWTSWGIQVGSFGNMENARELRLLLQGDGHHVSMSEVKVGGEQVTRVAVGPMLRQAEAERLREEFDKRYGLESVLVKFEA